jgi:hypothetical protein
MWLHQSPQGGSLLGRHLAGRPGAPRRCLALCGPSSPLDAQRAVAVRHLLSCARSAGVAFSPLPGAFLLEGALFHPPPLSQRRRAHRAGIHPISYQSQSRRRSPHLYPRRTVTSSPPPPPDSAKQFRFPDEDACHPRALSVLPPEPVVRPRSPRPLWERREPIRGMGSGVRGRPQHTNPRLS